MKLLDWASWVESQRDRLAENKPEERWFLQKLHRAEELGELATLIARRLADDGQSATVKVQSVWVDGLPQAIGYAGGRESKCELADLLYVVRTLGVGPERERALLLQGKMARYHNRLPSTGSTKEERALLEGHEWSRPFELHRAYAASDATRIGKFTLRQAPLKGFQPFARYLLIAATAGWDRGLRSSLSPYVTGWPQGADTSYLLGTTNVDLAQCAVEMSEAEASSPGHAVDGSSTEWDRLVWALRNGNAGRNMQGYGGQPYVRDSASVDTRQFLRTALADRIELWVHRLVPALRLAIVGWDQQYPWRSKDGRGGEPPTGWEGEGPEGFPLIPVITVTITFQG